MAKKPIPTYYICKSLLAPTQEAEGAKHEECLICSLRRSEGTVIDKLPPADHAHSYGTEWRTDISYGFLSPFLDEDTNREEMSALF